jgi:hypothetical protein
MPAVQQRQQLQAVAATASSATLSVKPPTCLWKLSFSATTVNPVDCDMSSPLRLTKLPVLSRYSNFAPCIHEEWKGGRLS